MVTNAGPQALSPAFVTVRLHPGAGRNEVIGFADGAWRVGVTAAPQNGKANDALIKLLARLLDVVASRITIEKGLTARTKRVAVEGLTAEEAGELLKAAVTPRRAFPGGTT